MAKQKRRTVRAVPRLPSRPANARVSKAALSPAASKLDRIVAALRAAKGATIPDLMTLTGWQAHSVRGALAGALKKRGLSVTSTKGAGERVYHLKSDR